MAKLNKQEALEQESKYPLHVDYNPETDPVLSLRHVDITFGSGRKVFKAVSDANFDIFKGETVSLVGESGSGKTTIGRAIVRINPCSAGAIYYKGDRISGKMTVNREKVAAAKAEMDAAKQKYDAIKNDASASEEQKKDALRAYNDAARVYRDEKNPRKAIVRRIQMIFQDPAASLNERATIEYIISEGLINFKMFNSEAERIEKVEKIIKEVGLLPEHLTRYPHEFSGGQRQRVGIARSVVMEPEFIVADEPISALDVSIRAQVLNLLKKFQREKGLTYLFIAHDLSIVRYISDRIVVIHLGKIVEVARTEELFAHPLHPYTKSLLSAIPIPDPILEKSKELFVYDKDAHAYGPDDHPALTDIGDGHFVYGTPDEIESYKAERDGK